MATLIHERTSSGGVRKCDSRCYNAKGPICNCVCNGINHGVGLRAALENTRKIAKEILNAQLSIETEDMDAHQTG
ncbi:MAG: hypothetical protein HPY71_13670 [Firmicutes bacterium]|jgi:hypothetical protein|nr:hypothetical protein [Bacillota bacterium]